MGGGKGSETSTTTVRLPPYLESAHKDLLNTYHDIALWLLYAPAEQASRPHMNYTDIEIEQAFFGAGYVIGSFPSLYDMYGKFMAGLDVEVLFDEAFADTIDGPVIHDLISAEADILSDDLETEAIPRFVTGMRDINSVVSSSFVVGKAMIEVGRTKAISRFSADTRARLLPIVADRWKTHLQWNRDVIEMYAQVMKLYISAKMDVDNHNMEVHSKDKLWPFNILHFWSQGVGALTSGASDTKQTISGGSQAQRAIGGAMQGMAAGGMIGGPIGAGIGGLIGLAGGLL